MTSDGFIGLDVPPSIQLMIVLGETLQYLLAWETVSMSIKFILFTDFIVFIVYTNIIEIIVCQEKMLSL